MNAHLKRPMQSAPSKAGFSLIEILVVMAIIAILMTLVLGIGGGASRGAAEAKAKAELQNLMLEIEAYREDNGVYPPVEKDPGDNNDTPSLGPTFKDWFDKRHGGAKYRLSDVKTSYWHPVDPWGNVYVYSYNPTQNPNVYRIGSLGPDGRYGTAGPGSWMPERFGKGDDITNRNGAM